MRLLHIIFYWLLCAANLFAGPNGLGLHSTALLAGRTLLEGVEWDLHIETAKGSGVTSQSFTEIDFSTGDYTIFIVANANIAQQPLLAHSTRADSIYSNYGGLRSTHLNPTSTSVEGHWNRPASSWSIHEVRRASGAVEIRDSGTLTGRGTNTSTFKLDTVGPMGTEIVFIGIVKRAMSRAQEAAVNRYLADKYAAPVNTGTEAINIVVDGDSIPYGYQTTSGWAWPWQLERLLGRAYIVVNRGVNGQTLADMQSDASTDIDTLLVAGKTNVLCVHGGTNDTYFGASSSTTTTRLQTYVVARKAAGWDRVIVIPVMSRSDSGTPGTFNADRATINAWIANGTNQSTYGFEAIALPTELSADGAQTNAIYFVDNCHPSINGHAIFAARMYQQITGDSGSLASSGLQFKLLGSDAGADGASVTSWQGDTGLAMTLAGGETAPVVHAALQNGEKGVTFGTSGMQNTSVAIGTSYTIMLCFADTGSAGNEVAFASHNDAVFALWSQSGGVNIRLGSGGAITNSSASFSEYTLPHLTACRNNGTTLSSLIGGANPGDIPGTTIAFSGGAHLGCSYTSAITRRLSGNIFGAAVWDRYVTDAEWIAARKYLAIKYGVVFEEP